MTTHEKHMEVRQFIYSLVSSLEAEKKEIMDTLIQNRHLSVSDEWNPMLESERGIYGLSIQDEQFVWNNGEHIAKNDILNIETKISKLFEAETTISNVALGVLLTK